MSDASEIDGASPLSSTTPPAPAQPEWSKGTVMDRRVFADRRTLRDPRTGDLAFKGEVTSSDVGSIKEVTAVPSTGEPVSGLERRRGKGRRLSDFSRAAQEGEMTAEQFMFLMAIDEFKKANGKTFPQWTDVLEVIRLLGYRKTMASELRLRRAEDWRENATSPSNVRPKNWSSRLVA